MLYCVKLQKALPHFDVIGSVSSIVEKLEINDPENGRKITKINTIRKLFPYNQISFALKLFTKNTVINSKDTVI